MGLEITKALTAKAASSQLQLLVVGDRIEARKGKKVMSFDTDAKRALEKALLRLEEDRLRKLDPLPKDREPILPSARKMKKVDSPPVFLEPPAPAVFDEVAVGKIISGSIIKPQYKDKYKKNGDYSCGDIIAVELREFIKVEAKGKLMIDLIKLKQVAMDNKVWKESYASLNPGQQRMTIGNCLRWRYKDGISIDIGGAVFDPELPDLGRAPA